MLFRSGQAEVYEWGTDATLVAYGSLFPTCVKAAEQLRVEGIEVGVINARFAKPLDTATLLKAVEELPLAEAVWEATAAGWGTLLGCVPGRLAYYYDECGLRRMLLERPAGEG